MITQKPASLHVIALGALAAAIIFASASCSQREAHTLLESTEREFILVGIDPPKHFYVDLQEPNGTLHKSVYVSKHCNSWRQLLIGQKFVLPYSRLKNPEGVEYVQINTSNVCPRGVTA